jgi:hypothetical protein
MTRQNAIYFVDHVVRRSGKYHVSELGCFRTGLLW